ncbi:MAG: hypothetical protein COW85_04975 [Ignavibacteria bacterium CG22_combo_CG10-13_8_21_14_all_37_15]|nr:MAG: hypothetical protein COW85_04975 [Ignavibacteria bacterium CG22_combo_CG10-13_8_21_14_all_37_15]
MKTNTLLLRILNRSSRFISTIVVIASMISAIAFSQPYDNPATVDLGTAANFRILAGSAITINESCTVTGDIGLSPTGGAAITGTGTVNGIKYSTDGLGVNTISDATRVGNAKTDLDAAYIDLSERTANATLDVSLDGQNLSRGIYSAGTFSLTTTVVLTGTATDIFIFKSAATLTTGASSHVTMGGTVLASNVFWLVTTSANIDGDFKGNLLAQTSITQTIGSIDGRLLARDAAVTVSGTSVLPVELTSFTAVFNNGAVELNWNTVTEVNNYGFEVERASRNEELGIRNWKKVGFVKGNGNSNSPKDYSFTDKTISYGSYAYRLKQLDNDGAFKYSKIVEADFKLRQTFELSQNYPNPFNPTTKISYSLPVDSRVQLLVYGITGEQVRSLVNEYQTAGIYTVDFDASVLSSGIYFYKIIANKFLQIKKMSVLK